MAQPQVSPHLVLDTIFHNFAIKEHVGIEIPVVALGQSQLFAVQVQEVQQHLQNPLVQYWLDHQSQAVVWDPVCQIVSTF